MVQAAAWLLVANAAVLTAATAALREAPGMTAASMASDFERAAATARLWQPAVALTEGQHWGIGGLAQQHGPGQQPVDGTQPMAGIQKAQGSSPYERTCHDKGQDGRSPCQVCRRTI